MSARVLVGLIGSGIQRSLTPAMHEREGAAQGLLYLYRLIDLNSLGQSEESLPDLLMAAERMGFNGLNVTYPCKQTVLPHLTGLSEDVRSLGAANTVVLRDGERIGHNTDWWGFAQAFKEELSSARFRSGCARAREPEEAVRHADGVVNATPVGMAKLPGMPIDAALLRPEQWVADIIYFPLETEFLRHARALGCRTMGGGGMAVFQAVKAFELFTGKPANVSRMRRHFAELCALATSPINAL
jgi:shikimate dehydrogenase